MSQNFSLDAAARTAHAANAARQNNGAAHAPNVERKIAFEVPEPPKRAAQPQATSLGLGDPVLPDVEAGPRVSQGEAAGVVLASMAHRQCHLAEAIHILTDLASARMASVGRMKVAFGKSQALYALEAADLDLKKATTGRRAGWADAAFKGVSGAMSAGDPVTGAMLGAMFTAVDKQVLWQRDLDDTQWKKTYLELRVSASKQMEELHGGEYDKAIRLLERSLETTRQMATNNTDTLKGVSHNL